MTMLFSFIGAVLGVITVVKFVESKYLYPIAIVLLLGVLFYTVCNKGMGTSNEFSGLGNNEVILWSVMAFVLGFYDGFFGPGTGSFLIFALIKIFKFDFTNASGNAKIYNLMSNIASVILFSAFGKTNYFLSLSIGMIMMIGGFLGAKFAVKGGTKFIKPVFLTVTSIVLSKMILESVFHVDVVRKIVSFFQ